jgi:Tol biopolymer transport system component
MSAAASVPARPSRVAWGIAATAVLVAASLALPALRHLREVPPADTRLVSFAMSVAPAERLGPTQFYGRPSRTAFAISPDGATIVFSGEVGPVGFNSNPAAAAAAGRKTMLYRRPLGEAHATAIAGTEGAEYPFFSADGASVGFAIGTTTGNALKKVALAGGPPIDVCDMPFPGRFGGASWAPSGVIVFALRGLWTVSSAGGKPAALVEDDPNVHALSPHILPDGKTVLFTEVSSTVAANAHVVAMDVATKQRKTILTNAADARYAPTGHLVFLRNAALLAVPFDASRLEVGAPMPLIAGIMQSTNALNGGEETAMGQFALSASGALVYASGDRYPDTGNLVVRVDRKGSETKIAETPGALLFQRVSPSGDRFVGERTGEGSRASDLWSYELPSGTSNRLTSTGDTGVVLFSPNGKALMFDRTGHEPGIYTRSEGTGSLQRLIEGPHIPVSWSSDGKWLATLEVVGGVRQIFVRPLRDGKPDAGDPRQFSSSSYAQSDGEFSPDARWLAYSTAESGASDVYVQPFPGPGEKHRISLNGGLNPAWSRNGRELFYLVSKPGDVRAMMAVDVSTTGDFSAGIPHQLFEGPYVSSGPVRSYDVTRDGAFIMTRVTRPPDQPVTVLNVVLGWASQLKTIVPVGK